MIISKTTKTGSLVLSSLNCTKLVEDDDHRNDQGLSSSLSLIGFFKSRRQSSSIPIVVVACNGLLCIRRETWDATNHVISVTFCIWNPCTNEFKESSVEPIINSDNNRDFYVLNNIYGFGYDQTIDDYKVISNTSCLIDNHYVTVVQVYTLGTNSWRRIQNYYPFHCLVSLSHCLVSSFVSTGATFYSLGSKPFRRYQWDVILCFDIAKEEYREMSKPWFVGENYVNLRDLNGCLGIAQPKISSQSWAMEVWMMEDYCHDNMNKNEYSWTKLYTIQQPYNIRSYQFKSLGIFNKNGGEILIQFPPYQDQIWYNEKDDSIRGTRSLKVRGNVIAVEVYIENLASLNSGTYMGQKEDEQQAEMVEDNQFYKQRRRRRRNRNGKHDLIIH